MREERRLAQLRARGAHADDSAMRAEVGERDRADTDRADSPLRAGAPTRTSSTPRRWTCER